MHRSCSSAGTEGAILRYGMWGTPDCSGKGKMLRVTMRAASIVAALVVLSGTSAVGAAAGSHGLRWHSPRKVTSGVPIAVASIQSCPPVPTPGDTTLVQVQLNYYGGSSASIVGPNPDGTWAADITLPLFGAITGPTTLSANCVDFTGHSGTPYANYMTRRVRVVP